MNNEAKIPDDELDAALATAMLPMKTISKDEHIADPIVLKIYEAVGRMKAGQKLGATAMSAWDTLKDTFELAAQNVDYEAFDHFVRAWKQVKVDPAGCIIMNGESFPCVEKFESPGRWTEPPVIHAIKNLQERSGVGAPSLGEIVNEVRCLTGREPEPRDLRKILRRHGWPIIEETSDGES